MSINEPPEEVRVDDIRDSTAFLEMVNEAVTAEIDVIRADYEQQLQDSEFRNAPMRWHEAGRMDRAERWAWFWMGAGAVVFVDVVAFITILAVTA